MTEPTSIQRNKLAELLAKRKAGLTPNHAAPYVPEQNAGNSNQVPETLFTQPQNQTITQTVGMHGEIITYNSKQQEFISLATSGQDCILLGAAGTGKTTCMRGTVTSLIQSGKAGVLRNVTHKYLASDSPGIVIIAYTRRAVANIRKVLPSDLQNNCITYHKLMEYEPEYYTVVDPETGDERTAMRFSPQRHAYNPLPESITTIIVEESSMFSKEYYEELCAALQHKVQFIFLGDIQQLPPVFGSAILGYKMLELPTVELSEVYRQALESPIIRLAHRILSGKPIPEKEFKDWNIDGKLKLHPWKKKLHSDLATLTAAKFFTNAYDHGAYNPESDAILIPFNKAFGTDEINRHIANHIARARQVETYEIVAGFNKYYFSVGDKVLYEKEDATIVRIESNPEYAGTLPQPESKTLDYWGHNSGPHKSASELSEEHVDFLLGQAASEVEDRVKQASHLIYLQRDPESPEVKVGTASGINALLLGYALTIHKSQGSEFKKVFVCLHQSHSTMLQRELLYTAVTRAREELYVICEPESFEKGILSQRIKGDTLKEKAEYFKGLIERKKQ